MIRDTLDADVVVLGAGPVGAAAALLLARQGLRVHIVDRSRTVYDLPRAVFLDGETTRSLQRVGLGEAVDAIMQPSRPDDAALFTNSRREPYFGLPMPTIGLNGWRDGAFFDQPEFDQRLREWLAVEPCARTFYGYEATDVGQDAQAAWVEATDASTGAAVRLRGRWLVACDGASSFVRRRLGIPWRSLGYDHDWLVADVVVDDVALLPPQVMQVCDPARLTTYICGKDPFRRWEFRLLPGETHEAMAEPEAVRRLIDPWIAREHYQLRRAVVYQFHAATAERWREGRIFLAGDAAHQTPPFLGQGLNAGFRDVTNLGWKLPMIAAGRAGEAILETYETEREPHGHELVNWAVAVGRIMDALAESEAGRASGPPPDDLMRSGYGQGRTAPPLRRGILVTEQVSDDGSVGYLLRQPWVTAPDGTTQLLDELLGPGFAIVGRDAFALTLSAAHRQWLAQVGARCVDLAALPAVRGTHDRLFATHAAAVVRPDRYVFGVTDDGHSLDDLVARLRTQLA